VAPHFEYVLPYLVDLNASQAEKDEVYGSFASVVSLGDRAMAVDESSGEGLLKSTDAENPIEEESMAMPDKFNLTGETAQQAIEIRLVLIELVRAAYHEMIQQGQIDARMYEGILVYSLLESLDLAGAEVARGSPLNDFDHLSIDIDSWTERMKRKTGQGRNTVQGKCCGRDLGETISLEKLQAGLDLFRAIAFM
jgi:hypothetical protein